MISILIVEDSQYKIDKIKQLLSEELMIDSQLVEIAMNIKSAKKLLITKTYDLLILDLVLPLETGDQPTPEKGIGFLNDLEANPSLKPPIHIIGLTSFGEFQKKFENDFSKALWYLIDYNASETSWQEKLKNKIYHLLTTKQRFREYTIQNQVHCDIFVMTALSKPEFDKILSWPVKWEKLSLANDPSVYYKCIIEKEGKKAKIIAACVEQMGMTATAVMTTKAIHNFKPRVIIMGGICAGLKERDLNYGDIIIAEQSWDYGSGKMKDIIDNNDKQVKDTLFEPDPRPIPLSPSLKSKIHAILRNKEILSKIQQDCPFNKPNILLSAQIGPVASGSYVISSEVKLQEIKSGQRKLLGVEMEGYGLYYACEHSQDLSVKGIMIKSVSDFGDNQKDDQFQDYSSFTSAQFIYHFILEELLG